jgi:hypothetical protein
VYDVRSVGEDVAEAIDALPAEFLQAFAELALALEVSPRSVGQPYSARNPEGSRTVVFGPGGRGLVLFVVAWCHLRNGEREFTVASILNVAPPSK